MKLYSDVEDNIIFWKSLYFQNIVIKLAYIFRQLHFSWIFYLMVAKNNPRIQIFEKATICTTLAERSPIQRLKPCYTEKRNSPWVTMLFVFTSLVHFILFSFQYCRNSHIQNALKIKHLKWRSCSKWKQTELLSPEPMFTRPQARHWDS